MSDYESSSSASCRSITAQPQTDEVLNDHRNQRETLPPPDDPELLSPLARQTRSQKQRRGSRSISVHEEETPGILLKGGRKPSRAPKPDANLMGKVRTNDSAFTTDGQGLYVKRDRRLSKTSIDSDADSHGSRTSQETEEDVCFPMLREHVRINGIDFDEIDDFCNEELANENYLSEQQRQQLQASRLRIETDTKASGTSYSKPNKNTVKYTPKNILMRTVTKLKSGAEQMIEKQATDSSDSYIQEKGLMLDDESSDQVKFGSTRVTDGDLVLPDRFSFFHSDNEETVHGPDIPLLLSNGQGARELFKNGDGTWWLDCTCPTDAEMKTLAKAFGIHPLTAEDIRMQETREKVELFRSYYFVCFHTFEPDIESEDYLEPINVYIVVFREGILTFHFSPISHPANVRRRVRQLREYVDVSADWLSYALIDDITDGFAPVITAIEYEADAIEDSVLVAASINFSSMLRKIGESRRKVMTLMRLLSNKADVIKMFAKRCQDEANKVEVPVSSRVNLNAMGNSYMTSPSGSSHGISFGPGPGAPANLVLEQVYSGGNRAQPRADIALYLGDIQDHVVTMFQNLSAYEKIFSRSHSNYLAQLQVESFNANLTVTRILGNVTLIGSLLLPLNVITGLFGMNVKVPGEGVESYAWWFGIVGFMLFLVTTLFTCIRWWLRRVEDKGEGNSAGKSVKSYSMKYRKREAAKSIISFPNRYD